MICCLHEQQQYSSIRDNFMLCCTLSEHEARGICRRPSFIVETNKGSEQREKKIFVETGRANTKHKPKAFLRTGIETGIWKFIYFNVF